MDDIELQCETLLREAKVDEERWLQNQPVFKTTIVNLTSMFIFVVGGASMTLVDFHFVPIVLER